MPTLFSYVVQHDVGFAPNPEGEFCTLAKCKFGTTHRNIVEMAEEGDWIAGTGGADEELSAGHRKLIYAMRVDEKIPLAEYRERRNMSDRSDAQPNIAEDGRFALISEHFFYFGRNAIDISEIPKSRPRHSFEKKGPRYRSDFTGEFIDSFANWLDEGFEVGVHGRPCKPHEGFRKLGLPPKLRRKALAKR